MLRRISLPLLLLLFLGGALVNSGSDPGLEQRVARLERLLAGEDEIPTLRVATVHVSESMEVADSINRVVLTTESLAMSSRNTEISDAQLESVETALHKMGDKTHDNKKDALRMLEIRQEAWCNNLVLYSPPHPQGSMLRLDECGRGETVLLTPRSVYVHGAGRNASSSLMAESLHIREHGNFRTLIGSSHGYMTKKESLEAPDARIRFFDPDGTVVYHVP